MRNNDRGIGSSKLKFNAAWLKRVASTLTAATLSVGSYYGFVAAVAAMPTDTPLVAQYAGWNTAIRMLRQLDTNGQLVGIGIQLDVLDKPYTTYGNAIYQLFANRNGRWEELYTNTGARLIPSANGRVTLAPEFIPIGKLEDKLAGTGDRLSNLDLKAVVSVKYDLPNGLRDQNFTAEQSQFFGNIATFTDYAYNPAVTSVNQPQTVFNTPVYRSSTTNTTVVQQTNGNTTTIIAPTTTGAPLGGPNNILSPNRGHFSLRILQNPPLLSQVVARVSLRSKRANGFLDERFVGDFLYNIGQRARFIRGLNPDDRIVVRLFDLQNQLIGYSEFELLPENGIVNLILPSQPNAYGTVRTVLGIDANQDGIIDPGVNTYDYFTQLNLNPGQNLADTTVSFLSSNQSVNLDAFNVSGLPYPLRNAYTADSLLRGSFALLNRPISVFQPDLASTLIVLPNQLVQPIKPNLDNSSVYEVTRQILSFSEVKIDSSNPNVLRPTK